MVEEGEKYAEQDEELRKTILAKNELENQAHNLKNQINDEDGWGAKLDAEDKETLLEAVEEAISFIEENGETASLEEFQEEQEKLTKVVSPIVSKMYASEGGASEGYHDEEEDDDEDDWDHDEL
ncbi:hypothetical protein JL09_g5832 [Pichia kudriavzevii]|nr:hypothetical protein JL09_g5832 [Pichia kudriavzevii]